MPGLAATLAGRLLARLASPLTRDKGVWWRRPEHLLDGAAPGFALDMLRQRYALGASAVALSALLTVTASAGKTYVDQAGTLQTAAANTPRIDWSSGVPELLLEGAATNLCPYSEDLTAGLWSIENVTTSGAPAGWWTVRETAAASYHMINRSSSAGIISTGTTYCISARVAKAGRRYVGFRGLFGASPGSVVFDLDAASVAYRTAGAATAGISRLPDGSHLIYASFAATSNINLPMGLISCDAAPADDTIPSFAGDPAKGFNFRYIQLEAGSIPTSYIPTATSAVTRTTDVCQLSAAAAAVLQGAGAAIAVRGVVRVSGGWIVGLAAAAGLLRWGGAAQVVMDGRAGANILFPGPPNTLPGPFGACAGWGAAGRGISAGLAATTNALPVTDSRSGIYIGSSGGLSAGVVVRLRQLVGWSLADRPTAAGILAQARVAT